MKAPIYLDYNATTPVALDVADAIQPFLDVHFGNPSSSHVYGFSAREAVAKARASVAVITNSLQINVIY